MRDLAQAVLDELGSEHTRIAVLAELDFKSGVQRLWAGPEGHTLEYDGQQWQSLADLGELDKVSEAQGLRDSRSLVRLRVNSANVDLVTGDDSRNRPAVIVLLLLEPDGTPIGDMRFRKRMGRLALAASMSERQIDENIELELLDETSTLGRREFQRMTHESQLRIDAADHGLEFVADTTQAETGAVRERRDVGRVPAEERERREPPPRPTTPPPPDRPGPGSPGGARAR